MLSGNVIPWNERALRKGLEQGRQEGRQEGHQEGRQAGRQEGLTEHARLTLERLLTRRFGPLSAEALQRIHQAPLPMLETWLDRVIDAPDLAAALAEH